MRLDLLALAQEEGLDPREGLASCQRGGQDHPSIDLLTPDLINFALDGFALMRSCDDRGKARNKLIRLSRIENASRKARSICSCVPTTAAGSGTLHRAVKGCPGQTGHASSAALSHTVKTKCILGASGLANSSQLLLRSPSVGIRAPRICFRASGRTRPAGLLPALYAVKFRNPL